MKILLRGYRNANRVIVSSPYEPVDSGGADNVDDDGPAKGRSIDDPDSGCRTADTARGHGAAAVRGLRGGDPVPAAGSPRGIRRRGPRPSYDRSGTGSDRVEGD